MAGNSFGQNFRFTTWGESHGPAIGVVVDGVPPRVPFTEADAQTYLDRRRALVEALNRAGVTVDTTGSGLNLWIPVDDERNAVVALAAGGIGAAPGGPFQVDDGDGDHIRLTISRVTDPDGVAEAVARAARRGGGTAGR